MLNGKYSEQEINNINEIEQQLNRDSQYITIAIGNSRILRFITERKIGEVEKTYNGQAIKKIRFILADPKEESKSDKYFDVGKRSARLMIAKLKTRPYGGGPHKGGSSTFIGFKQFSSGLSTS